MGARGYIHNFWKLGGATRIYDGNRAGGALKNHRGKSAPRGFPMWPLLRAKGKGDLQKAQLGLSNISPYCRRADRRNRDIPLEMDLLYKVKEGY